MVNFNFSTLYSDSFLGASERDQEFSVLESHLVTLHNKTGRGSDFLGWLDLPSRITTEEINRIRELSESWSKRLELVVVVGIGGSYLGAKAVIEALSHSFHHLVEKDRFPLVLFAGQNICEDYLSELLQVLETRSYGIVVISKSGTTTEPALAFRVLKDHLVQKEGREEAARRIIAITDANRGALRQLAEKEGYESFVIPDDIGGRFSVLTPVGLVPVALAGFDIGQMVSGARAMEKSTGPDMPVRENPAARYAVMRNLLYRKGKHIEVLVNYHPKLHYLSEWWKQLFGESEGKENKGIFPAAVDFTTDLHSLGQYLQDGLRNIFETVISVREADRTLIIPNDPENLDRLNFLSGKRISEVNRMAEIGTLFAHLDGGVPNLHIATDRINEYALGQLMYFFEISCAMSGYLLGVNPFDQPGVEDYKKNMFALLGKPGFEEEGRILRNRMNR